MHGFHNTFHMIRTVFGPGGPEAISKAPYDAVDSSAHHVMECVIMEEGSERAVYGPPEDASWDAWFQ